MIHLPVAIVAHDAGGAEILSSLVRRTSFAAIFSLEGPAKTVFQRKIGSFPNLSLEKAVACANTVLCGTSWQSSHERDAISLARSAGKRAIAFLDHWTNYKERFSEGCLPHEIWVGDDAALRLADEAFPLIPKKLVENPYFLDIKEKLFETERKSEVIDVTGRILFICEPVREPGIRMHGNPLYWGYTEEDALTFFLEHIGAVHPSIREIVIRPHPSESKHKYEWVLDKARFRAVFSRNSDIVDDIAECDVVVGCSSTAMAIALQLHKRVICCIPPTGPRCRLPFKEIEYLREITETK